MRDRRAFLQSLLGRGAAALEPFDGPWDTAARMHLLRRALVAPTRADVESTAGMSLAALVDALVTPPPSLPGPSRFVGECMNASVIYWDSARTEIIDTFFDELRRWWMLEMVNAGVSARERMTLFWHNHFANNARTIQDSRFLYLQNQLFRRNALGDFKRLVADVTVDKSMLLFLDGKSNKWNYRNENYARELQELFTIGIADNDGNPNYTQADVVEASRALTGWDWLGFGMQGDVGCSVLTGHDATDKTVYGATITGTVEGAPELARLLDVIFDRPETARYLIRKLYRFYVYADTTLTPVRPIPQEIETTVIAPLAEEFRQSGWSVAAVLRRLFMSRHFHETVHRGAMIKSPVDLMVSAVRGTSVGRIGGDAADFAGQYIQDRAATLGQDLFHPPGVQGWQFHRSWISATTLPQRHFYTDELLSGAASRITDRLNLIITGPIVRDGSWQIDVLAFARQFDSIDDAVALVDDIAQHLLALPASPTLRARLLAELVGDRAYEWPTLDDAVRRSRLRSMLRTLMRSTNFQLM